MLKSSSKFISKLRSDSILSPVVRAFSERQWRDDFKKYGVESAEEKIVFDAGLWIGSQLKLHWDRVTALQLEKYNFESFVSTLQSNFIKNYDVIQRECSLNSKGFGVSASDYGLTALGDSLWRALNFLGANRNSMVGTEVVEERIVFRLLELCNQIYNLEYGMGRITHCGWQLRIDKNQPIFEPSVPFEIYQVNEAISLNIREDSLLEFLTVYQQAWQQGKLRDQAPAHLQLAGREKCRTAFEIVMSPPNKMPLSIPIFEMDIPDWLRPTLTIKSENYEGISVSEILSGWLLLRELFIEIYEYDAADVSRLEHGCGIEEEDLLRLFIVTGRSKKVARILTDFLTYGWGRHEDLWGAPLVKIGARYFPFLPALLDINLTRTIDLWLKKCKKKTENGKLNELIGPRGLAFEDYVRTRLQSSMKDCSYVDSHVCERATNIVSGGDIDLLWRLDNLVIVGDMKFNKFPANPNEIGNYYRELEHGAEQAKDRVVKLAKKRPEVARKLGWKGNVEALDFLPLVVCGHPFGAGLSLKGVSCVQFDMLEQLFDTDEFFIYQSIGHPSETDIALPFIKRRGKFIKFFKTYLANPAAFWYRSSAVHRTEISGALLAGGEQIRFRRLSVQIPRNSERASYCRERRREWVAQFPS